ncbi:MAG: hypothetical protein MJ153_01045 [Clostridia bacterium]|nr:hypothetical protein [Clostridia bacterium]
MRTIDYYIAKIKEQREIDRSVLHEAFLEDFYAKNKELQGIDRDIVAQRTNKIIATLDGDVEAARVADILKIRLCERREEYLKAHNIRPDYETELPICDKCNDTGFYIGSKGRRRVCKCMNEALEECYEASGLGNFTRISKKNYDENYCQNKDRRRAVLTKITKIYQHMVESRNNIWLYIDGIQSGKTYLSVFLAKQIIGVGDSCAYIKLEDISDMSEVMSEIVKGCDILFIDDYSGALTSSGSIGTDLNNILEMRSGMDVPTVIITNESLAEIIAESDVRISGKLKFAERV